MIYWIVGGVALLLFVCFVGFMVGVFSECDRRYEMLAPLTKRVKSLEDAVHYDIFSEIAVGTAKDGVRILPVSVMYDLNYPSIGVGKLKVSVSTLLEKILENFEINSIQAQKAELKLKLKVKK